MRVTSSIVFGLSILLTGTAVRAQHALPPPVTAAGPAANEQPAAQPAAPATAPAVPAAPAAEAAAPAASAPAATADDAANDKARQQEWARIAQQRLEVQKMLARARASANAKPAQEREPEEPARHGDAGAAFALGVSFEAPWYTDPGYDVYAEDDVAARFGVWASYDVAALRDDAFLALELGWGTESEEGHVLGVADTKLSTQVAYAGAQVRWVALPWLQPHLRLAGGTGIIDAELDAGTHYHDGAGGVFEDMLSPFGSAGLGFTLRTNTRAFEDHHGRLASLSFGLMFEGGYTLAKPIDVALDGPGPSARDIELSEPKLGSLDRSGPYFRVSLVGRI